MFVKLNEKSNKEFIINMNNVLAFEKEDDKCIIFYFVDDQHTACFDSTEETNKTWMSLWEQIRDKK